MIKKERRRPIHIKATEAEKKKMKALADKYAGGNLSLFIRHAALNYSASKDLLNN